MSITENGKRKTLRLQCKGRKGMKYLRSYLGGSSQAFQIILRFEMIGRILHYNM